MAPDMLASARPRWNEADRLAALQAYRILDTEPEPAFDGLVELAAHVCRAPIALVTLVEAERQWFKAEVGLGLRETPIEQSFCAQALRQPDLFVVPDTREDPRFADDPPPLKWSALRYGLRAFGGRTDVEEETQA